MIWVISGLAGVLIAIHMARPRYRRQTMSSARFFRNLPPPRLSGGRLQWGKPRLSRSFFLQAVVLLLAGASLFAHLLEWKVKRQNRVGIWVLLDTSASMGASNGAPMAAALQQIHEFLESLDQQFDDAATTFRLSAFDLERRDLPEITQANSLSGAVRNLEPRSLGTDLNLIRNLLQNRDLPEGITHLLVFSDMPAPDIAADPRLIWRCVGEKLPNVGLTGVTVLRDIFTGGVRHVDVGLASYGPAPDNTVVRVSGPGNQIIQLIDSIPWQGDVSGSGATWRLRFPVLEGGSYRVELDPTDVFPSDNIIDLELEPGGSLRVDWQAGDIALTDQLGWVVSDREADLLVTAKLPRDLERPTIVLANMVPGKGEERLTDFREDHPLLTDVNLDALEQLALSGVDLPEGFTAIVRNSRNRVIAAEYGSVLLLPGPFHDEDQVAGKVQTTMFFNAVRHLLQDRSRRPVTTLTTPLKPRPEPNHLAIHPGEGNTWRQPVSLGEFDNLARTGAMEQVYPLWALFLALAVLALIAERAACLFGGTNWR